VTPAKICDSVDMIGFGCELIGMTEIKEEQRKKFNNDGQSISEVSLDSAKIRGEDQEEGFYESEEGPDATSNSPLKLENSAEKKLKP